MTTVSLVFWVTTITLITTINAYFFVKVLRTKPHPEPGSYSENDPEPR